MVFKFFIFTERVESFDLVKRTYRLLAKKYHPDHGGTDEAMAQINAEFEEITYCIKNFGFFNHPNATNNAHKAEEARKAEEAHKSQENVNRK